MYVRVRMCVCGITCIVPQCLIHELQYDEHRTPQLVAPAMQYKQLATPTRAATPTLFSIEAGHRSRSIPNVVKLLESGSSIIK